MVESAFLHVTFASGATFSVGLFVHVIMVALSSKFIKHSCNMPYVIGQTIIFLPSDFYLLSSFILSFFFFPRLISALADWMSIILPHMV